tara:strand:- start:389 stop:1330 length:942 start_codon:yes stop_codon:yes gene_type:complete
MNPILKYKMKLLVICRKDNIISPYVEEQADQLRLLGIEIDYLTINSGGFKGYFDAYRRLKILTNNRFYDLIHAHYGLCGLIANLQWNIRVITTFHGGDLYLKQSSIIILFFCWVASVLSNRNIFTTRTIPTLYKIRKYEIIPCGVELKHFSNKDKYEVRKKLNIKKDEIVILFSGAFDDENKNSKLALESIGLLNFEVKLIELKNFSRRDVNNHLNACDILLVTSYSETGPLIVKEAIACNTPVISTDVGDVKEYFGDFKGCNITSYDSKDLASTISMVLQSHKSYSTSNYILESKLDGASIAKKVYEFYNEK